LEKLSRGQRVALITIIGKEGSAPRDLGAMMAVFSDGSRAGTLGGGELEEIVVREALSAIAEGKCKRLRISLGLERAPEDSIKTKMACGGLVEVFINVIQPTPRVVVIGAGHVGKPLADIGHILGLPVLVVDKNPDLASPEKYPYAERIVGGVVDAIDRLELSENDIVLLAYGEPETDYQVLKKLLLKGFKGHVWVLCSRRRAHWMIERLREEAVIGGGPRTTKIHAPAGLDIGSDAPGEIAVSIWAEVICELRGCEKPVNSLSVAD